MGFLEYAETLSLQKDPLKSKILTHHKWVSPTLKLKGSIPLALLPEPKTSDEAIEFLGYVFPPDEQGRRRSGRLFRAAVTHLTAHMLLETPLTGKSQSHPERFTETLLRDLHVDAYLMASHPERLPDMAYANALALASAKRLEKIFLPATRVMMAILSRVFVGDLKGQLPSPEAALVEEVVDRLSDVKSSFVASLNGGEIDADVLQETADWIAVRLREFSPFVETPCFPHMENPTPCSIYVERSLPEDLDVEPFFMSAMEALGGTPPVEGGVASCWGKAVDVECLQAFSSTVLQYKKEMKILRRLEERLSTTHFKSIEIPTLVDYSEYLRARNLIGGSTRRLLNNIIVATNFALEDIRKQYGVLDLADAMQVVASKSDRNDIFMRDELLKQSFTIAILLDVSKSMKTNPLENRARAICIAEAMKDIITDSNSWAFYAFSDRLYVLKDGSEAYSRRVRSRIGGVPFDGATYMPDAIKAAAEFLKDKIEEQTIIIILSDGYPFGYPGIHEALEEVNQTSEQRNIIILGLGFDTDRMGGLFRYSTPVYSQKDLIKKVGSIFLQASMGELI